MPRFEAIAICAGLASLFAQGLFGDGDTIAAAALVFSVSAVALWLSMVEGYGGAPDSLVRKCALFGL